MTSAKKQLLLKPITLYRQSKSWFNYLCDRVIDYANLFLTDNYGLPWPQSQKMVHRVARFIGELSWLLRSFPRLPAYKLIGENWVIIFVGREQELSQARHLFFQNEDITPHQLERVALWHLAVQTEQWLAEGVDLIICELSRICPWKPKAPVTFTTPDWIDQVLYLPEPLETILFGKQMRTVRNNLNNSLKAGFSWYFSHDKKDFDHFHYQMYLPYIRARHGDRALLASYQDQWRRWFTRGGLLMLTQNNAPIGGVICYTHNQTCFVVELGVLNGNLDLVESGFKTAMDWFAMNWAYQQGIRIYDMGGSRPWQCDGVFFTKSRWRPKVVRRKKIYGVWTFLAHSLSPALQNHLNKLGPISEIEGKFYGVWLSECPTSLQQGELQDKVAGFHNQGLAGLALVSAGTTTIFS